MVGYLIEFDTKWETICKINKLVDKLEVVTHIIPILYVETSEENIEKIKKIEGVINIEKSTKGSFEV